MSTDTKPTNRKIKTAAQRFLEAKAAADRAAKALEIAKKDLLGVLHAADQTTVVVEGLGSVLLVECEKTSVDVNGLRPLVSQEVLDLVTKRNIDLDAWRTALDRGIVPENVARVVESKSTYEQVRTSTAGM